GKTATSSQRPWATLGSPPRAWGRRARPRGSGGYVTGSPPRAWGRRPAPSPSTCMRAVHPHVRGEDADGAREGQGEDRFTPTCVGKTGARLQVGLERRFTPTCV